MAPSKAATSSSSSSSSSSGSTVVKAAPQKLRRNERERKRVNQVNQGFLRLRDRVPKQPGCKQKMSKVETLREAARYIQLLQSQLGIMTCASSSAIDFPTPEHSPNYLPPQIPPSCHVAGSPYDYNNISPYYPQGQNDGMLSYQCSGASSGASSTTTTVSSVGRGEGISTSGRGTTTSPGSTSFYSDTSYEEYMQ